MVLTSHLNVVQRKRLKMFYPSASRRFRKRLVCDEGQARGKFEVSIGAVRYGVVDQDSVNDVRPLERDVHVLFLLIGRNNRHRTRN